ncbi:hypothetical protein BROUX41_000258 [Berkeleyomyces rouxiae]|uniref:uncharacterized protein n=1 Tax=Berkeleyomyces rouxiae TaxID=2035830 RepID=UPI003B77962E
MSSSLKDLIDGEADLDEEEDESFDEEDSQSGHRAKRPVLDDSSEEEEDEDEEEMRKVQEGFIVDEDEDDAEGSDVEARRRRKRSHRDREEDEMLDDEDLELIGEGQDWKQKTPEKPKYKRLKSGAQKAEDRATTRRGLDDIFDDDEEDDRAYGRSGYRPQADDMDDFIEDDYPDEDDDDRKRAQEEAEVARPRGEKGVGSMIDTTGLDKDALQDMEDIFGDGGDYAWALELEEEEQDQEKEEQTIELKDVFEPSQLKEKLLTDFDNEVRFTDEPERFQIDRKPFANLQLTDDQLKEEARWIVDMLWPKKDLSMDYHGHFLKCVSKVLEFFLVDEVEVPFIFQHKKDYLIYSKKIPNPERRHNPDAPEFKTEGKRLLNQEDLWRILDLDLKFRSLVEKRNALAKAYGNLKTTLDISDPILEEMMPQAATLEELQDLQDYFNFQYSAEIRDSAIGSGNATTKRPGSKNTFHERVRKSPVYRFVRAYGLSADQLAKNALGQGRKITAEDDSKDPISLSDSLICEDFSTSSSVINAARSMFTEELFFNPRLRKFFRLHYYQNGEFDCHRTEKGLRKIDEVHPFYEVKYLVRQTIHDMARKPELFVKMLKGEEEGLLDVKLELRSRSEFRKRLDGEFESENYSDIAQSWKEERRRVLDMACAKLERVVTKGVKESVRTACNDELLLAAKEEFYRRLDQAPYKPKGLTLGTTPRVLTLSVGLGDPARDPIFYTFVDEQSRILEHGRFHNLARKEEEREKFVNVVKDRLPDVIGVSGFSADTQKLVRDLETLVMDRNLRGPEYEDSDGEAQTDLLEVLIVNDEVARLYKDSPRAVAEHTTLHPMTRYCFGLARYMQDPMKEYAALGKDVVSLSIHPCQKLLPDDKFRKTLETAMVDIVNLVGVNINDAVHDPYYANLLPYVSGLGPRKSTNVIKAINANGGSIASRDELVGDPDSGKLPVVGPRVWNNCASFLYIDLDTTNPAADPMDSTRVHPEDYELGRKMVADALDLDEEDVKAETDDHGPAAIVRKLFRDNDQYRINELILEEYADQLENNYSQRKRATLEAIRFELQNPYEEIRTSLMVLTPAEVFTMLTGETKDSLARDMIVPVNVRVIKDDFAIVKLDCGVEGRVEALEVNSRGHIRDSLQVGMTTQAKIIEVNFKDFIVKLSMRPELLRRAYRRPVEYGPGQWDFDQEEKDREDLREKDRSTGRAQRVIKHPLFKPFNGMQAEQFLGSQPNGEVVIRPSSLGNDHLAVTWKVDNGVFQHIDVVELQKENEFSVGKTLRIGGKFTYTDLDELIVEHVKSMAKKVEQLMRNDKFHRGSRADLEKWLTTYMEANPNRSTYAFCIDSKHPGYFWLCFKASKTARVSAWSVKIIPHAYQMMNSEYPDMRALCNGFKLRHQNEVKMAMQKLQIRK